MAVFHCRLVIMISHDIFSFSYSNFNFSYSVFLISRSDFPISHSDFSISHIDHLDSIGDFQLNPLLSCLACHKNPIFHQVTIYQCEAKGVVKLLQAYMDADVSFCWHNYCIQCPIPFLKWIWVNINNRHLNENWPTW